MYFVGRGGAPKVKAEPSLQGRNSGYDDEDGNYQVVLHDHLNYRYKVLALLGKGSCGQVRCWS